MPKHNPKLDKPQDKKGKKDSSKTEYDPYEYRTNYNPYYMAIIFIGVVAIIVVLFFFVFNITAETINKEDTVKLDYDVYLLEQYQNHEEPEIQKRNKFVLVCSRYDDDCDGDLVKGFYKELLGKKVGDSRHIYLDKCKDDDKDGKDDTTGDKEDAESYGFTSDGDLYYKDIVIWYKVIAINKTTSEEESSLALKCSDLKTKPLEIFNFIFFGNKKELIVCLDKKVEFLEITNMP